MAGRLDEPDLVVLARVIDRGSFARAAAELDVPPSTLSRRIAALERRLGVRALERTTRHLRATEVGELLAANGRRVRAELEDADRVVADHRSTPKGLLRLSIPTPAGELLGPAIAEMLTRYPDLRVEIVMSEAPLDLIEGSFDVALYAGTVSASATLGVLRLGTLSPVLGAAASYLRRAPALRHPRDLADPAHTILRSGRSRRSAWSFVHGKTGAKATVVPGAPRAFVTSKSLVVELVAAGLGVGLVPRMALATHPGITAVEPGGYRPESGPLSIVTPSARTSAPKVRAFTDAMKALVAARPDLFD